MASVTQQPPSDSPPQRAERADELLIDKQISRTRRSLKLVDFTAGLITLAIGILAFLLLTSVLEHWVIPGGWSDLARTVLFASLLLGVAWYSWRTFLPLLGQSINPAYAAVAIEQSSPSLKNSLLNFLLLRNGKRHLPRQVYQAIEQQAAHRLSQVSLESVVDRSAILRLGYVLVAIVALCAVYRFLSPKDLISSAGRVLLPWSTIATPSRVQILGVSPGDAKAARGEQLRITAEVLGLEADEPVRLFYSTDDEQIVGQEIPMSTTAGGSEFQCQVPARVGAGGRIAGGSGGGIQQDFSYWIEAGDARSPRYQVMVFARPTLVVNRLRYEYPAYTGYPSRDVEHTGDIRAVEGTLITLFAQANKPIKTAHVDFEADGRRDLRMNHTDQQATVTFPLTLRDDRRTPRYRSYVLRYLTSTGNQNQQPPKYQIDVQPDYSPEIQLLLPEAALLEVALNQEVDFKLEARDPDFALSQVLLIGKVGEEQLLQEELLARNHSGRFVGKLRKTPKAMGLKVGDVLEYWGTAADNRRPEANLAYSAHRRLRVIGPWQGNQEGEKNQDGEGRQQPGDGGEPQEGEGGTEGQAGGGEQGNSGEGEAGAGEGSSDQDSDKAGDNAQQQGQGGEGSSEEGEQEENGKSQGNAQGNSPSDDSNDSESQNEGGGPAGDPSGDRADESAGGAGGDQGKVSSEGDDDGSAFDRMAKHFREQEGEEESDPTGSGESGEGGDGENQTKTDRNADGGSPDADQSGDDRSGKGRSGKGRAEEGRAENGRSGDERSGEGQSGEEDAPQNDEAQDGDQTAGKEGEAQDRQAQRPGAKGEPAAGETEKQGSGEDPQQQDGQSPDNEMSPEQGDAGAGDSSGEDQGAPNPDGAKSPRDRQGDLSDDAGQENSEAPSKSRDQAESDSEGGQGGDRSGGGKEGAGQQAEQEGKGGAGEHEAADDGSGQAAETGEGDARDQPGGKEKAAGETGESSGDQAGKGSEKGAQAGEKPDGETASDGDQVEAGTEPSGGQSKENSKQQPDDQQSPPSESDPADAQGQAGNPSGTGGRPSSPPPGGETAPGDEANLEYARKQTDLILNRLDDQLKKQEVDKSLLEKLGWTQDELRRFVDRWKNLQSKADSKAGSPAEKNELNDALRSLGLQRNRRTGFKSKTNKDELRDLQDSFRGQVPLEFQEQVRSYIKGTAAAQENE